MSKFKRKVRLCDFGCGRKAKYHFKTGAQSYCCESNVAKCPAIKKKTGFLHSNEHKRKIGDGVRRSYALISEEEKARRYEKHRKGENKSLVCKAGEIAWNRGIPHSEKTKQKMSNKLKGISPWNKGKVGVYSEEVLKDISNRMKNGGAAYALSFIKNPSKPQVSLYNLVKLLYPDAILNYPSLNKSIDIAIPDKMIAIEYDNAWWHDGREKQDAKRQSLLENVGKRFKQYI